MNVDRTESTASLHSSRRPRDNRVTAAWIVGVTLAVVILCGGVAVAASAVALRLSNPAPPQRSQIERPPKKQKPAASPVATQAPKALPQNAVSKTPAPSPQKPAAKPNIKGLPFVVSIAPPGPESKRRPSPLEIDYDPQTGLLFAIYGGLYSSVNHDYHILPYSVVTADDGTVSLQPAEPFPDVEGEVEGATVVWPDGPDKPAQLAVYVPYRSDSNSGEVLFFDIATRQFAAACKAPPHGRLRAVGGVWPSVAMLTNGHTKVQHLVVHNAAASEQQTTAQILRAAGLGLPESETLPQERDSFSFKDDVSLALMKIVAERTAVDRDRPPIHLASRFHLSQGETPLIRVASTVYNLAGGKIQAVFDFIPMVRVPGSDVVLGVRERAIAAGSLATGQTIAVRQLPSNSPLARPLPGTVSGNDEAYNQAGASRARRSPLVAETPALVDLCVDVERDLVFCLLGRELLVDQLSSYTNAASGQPVVAAKFADWVSPLESLNQTNAKTTVAKSTEDNAKPAPADDETSTKPSVVRRLETEFDGRIQRVLSEPGGTVILIGPTDPNTKQSKKFLARVDLKDGRTLAQSTLALDATQFAIAGDYLLAMPEPSYKRPSRYDRVTVPLGVVDLATLKPRRLEQVFPGKLSVVPGQFVLLGSNQDTFIDQLELPSLKRIDIPDDPNSYRILMSDEKRFPKVHPVDDGFLWNGVIWSADVKSRRMLVQPAEIALAGTVEWPSTRDGQSNSIEIRRNVFESYYNVLAFPLRIRFYRPERTVGGSLKPGAKPSVSFLRADRDEVLRNYILSEWKPPEVDKGPGGFVMPWAESSDTEQFVVGAGGQLWTIPFADVTDALEQTDPVVEIVTQQDRFTLSPSGKVTITCTARHAESVVPIDPVLGELLTPLEEPPGDGARSGEWTFQLNVDQAVEAMLSQWSKEAVNYPIPTSFRDRRAALSVQARFEGAMLERLPKYLARAAPVYREITGKEPRGIPVALSIPFLAVGRGGGEATLSHTYLIDMPKKRFQVTIPKGLK